MIDPVYMQANELKTKLQCAFFFSSHSLSMDRDHVRIIGFTHTNQGTEP